MRDNIIHGSNILWMIPVIFSILPRTGSSQSVNNTLQVVNSPNLYHQTVQKDSNQRMMDLRRYIPAIVLDLRYATAANFTKQQLYPPVRTSFLRLPAAKALAHIQEQLKRQGLALKIFDAYRPYSITKRMWELVHDPRYVADPAKGSGHNRGIAVDLTLIDLATGKELPMPTGFDNFTDSAHHDFMDLPEESIRNRNLLKGIMEKYGFEALKTEWWHYSLPHPENFRVLDLTFDDLYLFCSNDRIQVQRAVDMRKSIFNGRGPIVEQRAAQPAGFDTQSQQVFLTAVKTVQDARDLSFFAAMDKAFLWQGSRLIVPRCLSVHPFLLGSDMINNSHSSFLHCLFVYPPLTG